MDHMCECPQDGPLPLEGPEVELWADGPEFQPAIKAIKRLQNYAFNRMTADVGAECY
jgi:hypothetical protein